MRSSVFLSSISTHSPIIFRWLMIYIVRWCRLTFISGRYTLLNFVALNCPSHLCSPLLHTSQPNLHAMLSIFCRLTNVNYSLLLLHRFLAIDGACARAYLSAYTCVLYVKMRLSCAHKCRALDSRARQLSAGYHAQADSGSAQRALPSAPLLLSKTQLYACVRAYAGHACAPYFHFHLFRSLCVCVCMCVCM
jgi:hypothetical protein